MDFNKQRGSRIESLRANKGISQLELAKMLGYKSDSTISKWESGASIPTGTKIVKLAQVLGTSTDYILYGVEKPAVSDIQSIYDDLNDINKKKVVDLALALRDKQNRKPIQMTTVFITGFVSAGNGVMQDDYVDAEITIPSNEVPDEFDSIAKVIGESMSPKIKDGDLLFIKHTPQVENNDIAIFQVNGENYVKQFKSNGTPYLKSLNPDYDNVYLSENDDIRTIGEVVDIYRV
ncbi:helix-turn-helix domain-containing protein [Pseudomonas putida]|jgi:phage repressor protein C with HTH and peptisase S24 domain|uniref:XRE family transcriptional regulator n=1 Tax=Pseudomonas putida TaxID=303 RepID=A0A2C5WJ09_PSEPU|nr:XRE family transcriptional regulator [Pseudomonas putida]PHH44284.1 XRE family transcriptional regulator [Pseudomonas putida]DAJ52873.1 MAG TPA: Repressor protein CI [Caudoviricetes sp.]DAN75774.1 MAG TPA: Repressor protein CI [Caudoviricetes sp.]